MIYSPTSKPEGTIRDWLNYHAKTSPNKVSYQFSDNGSELTWLELLNRVKLDQKKESRKKIIFTAATSIGLVLFGVLVF